TQFRKHLRECSYATLRLGIVFVVRHEHADAPHAATCCARPTTGHAAALPSPAMNSRRRISDLLRLDRQHNAVGVVCLGLTQSFLQRGRLLVARSANSLRRSNIPALGGIADMAAAVAAARRPEVPAVLQAKRASATIPRRKPRRVGGPCPSASIPSRPPLK